MALFACAQKKGDARLLGFKQWVSKGKAPEITEQTQTRTSEGAGRNYFLYAASPFKIVPVEAWIEGEPYRLMVTPVETPVEFTDERIYGAPKTVLVPKSTDRVVRLSLIPPVGRKSRDQEAASLAKSNEFVLVYKTDGKFYYATLEKLKLLESTAAQ